MSFSKGLLLNSLHTVPLATVATALGCVPAQPSLGSSVSLWSRLHRVAVSAYVRLLLEGFRSGRGDWMLEAEGRLWCLDWGWGLLNQKKGKKLVGLKALTSSYDERGQTSKLGDWDQSM